MVRRTHYTDRKPDLPSRLWKAEGQVRGLQRMIDSDRYGLDVVHQVEAAVAALREVSGIALESHLELASAGSGGPDHQRVDVLRRTRNPIENRPRHVTGGTGHLVVGGHDEQRRDAHGWGADERVEIGCIIG